MNKNDYLNKTADELDEEMKALYPIIANLSNEQKQKLLKYIDESLKNNNINI